jgi:hypothetical protein
MRAKLRRHRVATAVMIIGLLAHELRAFQRERHGHAAHHVMAPGSA